MMTGYASKETAVEAMRLGAFDYIEPQLVEISDPAQDCRTAEAQNQNIALKTRVHAAEGSIDYR